MAFRLTDLIGPGVAVVAVAVASGISANVPE
jgi:hypothetical protein